MPKTYRMETQRTQVLHDQLLEAFSTIPVAVLDVSITLHSAYESALHVKLRDNLSYSVRTVHVAFPIDRFSEPLDPKLLIHTALIKYDRKDWSYAKHGGEFRHPFIDDSPETSRYIDLDNLPGGI